MEKEETTQPVEEATVSKQEFIEILTRALGDDIFADLDARYLWDLYYVFDEETNSDNKMKLETNFIKAMHEAIESSVHRRAI